MLAPIVNAFPKGQTALNGTTDQLSVQGTNTVREDSGLFRETMNSVEKRLQSDRLGWNFAGLRA